MYGHEEQPVRGRGRGMVREDRSSPPVRPGGIMNDRQDLDQKQQSTVDRTKASEHKQRSSRLTGKGRARAKRPEQQLYVPRALRSKESQGHSSASCSTETKQHKPDQATDTAIGTESAEQLVKNSDVSAARTSVPSTNIENAPTAVTAETELVCSESSRTAEIVCDSDHFNTKKSTETVCSDTKESTETVCSDTKESTETVCPEVTDRAANNACLTESNQLQKSEEHTVDVTEDMDVLESVCTEVIQTLSENPEGLVCSEVAERCEEETEESVYSEVAEHVKEDVVESMCSVTESGTGSSQGSEEEEEEDSWDKLFDDNGDCLDSSMMEELSSFVGEVEISKPKKVINYLDYTPKESDLDMSAYGHVIEISDFPASFQTADLLTAFKEYMNRGFDIKWVDDTHALGIFSGTIAANDALKMIHPMMKLKPLTEASKQSRLKAKRCQEFLQPFKPRPQTSAAAARRLVTGALGLAPRMTKEKRDEERKVLKEARDKKRKDRKNKEDIWNGNVGKCAMDSY